MYKLSENSIIRTTDGASIPADPANTDYAAYLRWVEKGNTPEPADPPPAAPEPINPVDKLRAFLAANPDVAEILK
jgi:hypothetical protein